MLKLKYAYITIFLFSFLFGGKILASTFPNDAKSKSTASATTGRFVLIATSTTPITILYGNLISLTSGSQQMLQCLTGTSTYNTLINEVGTSEQEYWGSLVLASSTVCYLRTFDSTLTQAMLTWVNYDISSTTSSVFGSTTNMLIDNDIGKVAYIATSTTLSNGSTITQATYYIPMNLFYFIVVLLIFLALVVGFYFYALKK